MPKGSKGEKRPTDLNKLANKIMKVATEGEDLPDSSKRKAGLKGSASRKKSLTKQERSKIAKKAAKKRWEL